AFDPLVIGTRSSTDSATMASAPVRLVDQIRLGVEDDVDFVADDDATRRHRQVHRHPVVAPVDPAGGGEGEFRLGSVGNGKGGVEGGLERDGAGDGADGEVADDLPAVAVDVAYTFAAEGDGGELLDVQIRLVAQVLVGHSVGGVDAAGVDGDLDRGVLG